ncbi:MAG TPA: tetratricopeptide repeat protein, partial [Vicinamibacteria bacterium]
AGLGSRLLLGGSLSAALFFGLHPLRVEVVAWASALPYVLALACLLVSVLVYLRGNDTVGYLAALAAYAASLLCRPIALGFPLVVFGLELARSRTWRRALGQSAPFALLAGAAFTLEVGARTFADWERVGLGPRLSATAMAPIVYLTRELAPFRLSPLDVSAIAPETSWLGLLAGSALLIAAALLAFKTARDHPWPVLAAGAYLALLAPAMGLAPSGLQATADRYTYLPDVALALCVGAGFAKAAARWRAAVAIGAGLALALGGLSVWQTGFWKDSVTLWTRALELDARNDVASYNLALALEEAGDRAGAERHLRETLLLVPEHALARGRLASLEARRLEQEAGERAAAGQLESAVALLDQSIEKEPGRMRPHASRGMALAELGRCAEALRDLETALDLGNDEVEVASGLAFCLLQTGRLDEALQSAAATAARHPDEPRVYGALATIQGAAGRFELAAASARRGAAVARRLARSDLAQALESQAMSYERKSPGR